MVVDDDDGNAAPARPDLFGSPLVDAAGPRADPSARPALSARATDNDDDALAAVLNAADGLYEEDDDDHHATSAADDAPSAVSGPPDGEPALDEPALDEPREDDAASDDPAADAAAADRLRYEIKVGPALAVGPSPADGHRGGDGGRNGDDSSGGGRGGGDGDGGDGPADEPVSPLDAGHPEYQSIVRRSVLEAVRLHGEANPDIEVCGVLVGTVYDAPQAPLVYVEAMIRGENSAGRSTQVTFTAETWQHVHRVMETEHPGRRILGWYHTHPGFGIFLSEMDLFIQRHFFNAPWQVAFVYDPRSRDAGMFAWRAAQVRRVDFVLDDEPAPPGGGSAMPPPPSASPAAAPRPTAFGPPANEGGGPAAPPAVPAGRPAAGRAVVAAPPAAGGHGDPSAPVAAGTLSDLADRVLVLESRVKWLLVGFAILLVVVIIWPLVVTVVMPPPGHQPVAPADPWTKPDPLPDNSPSAPGNPSRGRPSGTSR